MENLIVVTGADSGLGAALLHSFEKDPRNYVLPIYGPGKQGELKGRRRFDLSDESELLDARFHIAQQTHFVDPHNEMYRILINCAGINYIEWFPVARWDMYHRLMDLNLKAALFLTQSLVNSPPLLDGEQGNWFLDSGAVLNIVSNASHMPMTNSAFYNASKGALHIATLAMARELRKTHGLCVFGISPNKLAGTGMSDYIEGRVPELRGWTPEQAAQYQLAALPAGEETDPYELADFIAYLLSEPKRHKYLTNTIIPYGA